jgi:serine/threonine protein phosphatase PrpC
MQMEHARQPLSVTVESWGWSQAGNSRAENQDSFLSWAERMIWAVADGVGGSDHGGAASKCIARLLLRVPRPESLDAHVENTVRGLREANGRFRHQVKTTGATAASTVVVLLIHEDKGACLWAGDSRCYLFRDGVLYQCTKDQTLRQKKIDKGELTAPEARRMVRGNIITNAVGVRDDLSLEEVRFSLRAGDRFLLCSDGLSNILSPEMLSAFLNKTTVKNAVDGIKKAVNGMAQPDNITFVAVFISGPA